MRSHDLLDSFPVRIIPVSQIPFSNVSWDFNTLSGWDLSVGTVSSHAFAGQPSGVNFIPFYDSPVIPAMLLGGNYWADLETTYFSIDTKTRSRYINTSRPGNNRFARPDITKTGALTSQPFFLCGNYMAFGIAGTEDAGNIRIELFQK